VVSITGGNEARFDAATTGPAIAAAGTIGGGSLGKITKDRDVHSGEAF